MPSKARLDSIKQWVQIEPNDPERWRQLAEAMQKHKRCFGTLYAANRAWQLYREQGEPDKAAALVHAFGKEIASEEGVPSWQSFLALIDRLSEAQRAEREVRIPEGAVLMRQGDPADALYLVLEGRLAVLVEGEKTAKVVNLVGQGALIGEGALDGHPRSATIVAEQNSRVLRLSRDEARSLLLAHPDLAIAFGKERMLRARITAVLAQPALHGLGLDLARMLAHCAWIETHQAGTVLKEPDEYLHAFCFVQRGIVHLFDVHESTPVYAGRIGPAGALGFPALFREAPSSLLYRAETEVELLCIGLDDVRDLMDFFPSLRTRLVQMARRFSTIVMETVALHHATAGELLRKDEL